MNLEYIEDLINRENINLIDTYLEDSSGAFVNYNKLNIILYDSSKLPTLKERKEVLAEELGHYYYDATYKFDSSLQLVSKQERKAKKWSYGTLVPFEELKKAIKNGMTEIYSLAEYFDVSNIFMSKCLVFYLEKYGTII